MGNAYNVSAIGKIKKLEIPCPNSHVRAALPDSNGILPDIKAINPIDFCRVEEVQETRCEEKEERQGNERKEKCKRALEAQPQDDTDCQKECNPRLAAK